MTVEYLERQIWCATGSSERGDIFMAWSDRPWVLDGAAVRVSMVGFDSGDEIIRCLDGKLVNDINPDLTSAIDLTSTVALFENQNVGFLGMMKGGPFDIDANTAERMLNAPLNLNGRPNSDVVRPRMNAKDITSRWSNTWIIDFAEMALDEASRYEQPFSYVRDVVKPVRDTVRDEGMR